MFDVSQVLCAVCCVMSEALKSRTIFNVTITSVSAGINFLVILLLLRNYFFSSLALHLSPSLSSLGFCFISFV